MLLVIFIYTLILYTFLWDNYYHEFSQNLCTSPFHCFLSTTKYGLLAGGGIGEDFLMEPSY